VLPKPDLGFAYRVSRLTYFDLLPNSYIHVPIEYSIDMNHRTQIDNDSSNS
jgi:hypothetical protein